MSDFINNLLKGIISPPDEWNTQVSDESKPKLNPELTGKVPTFQEAFALELRQIKSAFLKDLALKMGERVPSYFYEVPASSTGKYHPEYCLGHGGLLRHTKAAVKIAVSLFEATGTFKFNPDDRDVILVSLIFHDTLKHNLPMQEYTVTEHPMLVAKHLLPEDILDGITEAQENLIMAVRGCIQSHMGCWNTDNKGNKIMPEPSNNIERFVHLCDYLSSRRFINVDL